MIRQATIEDLPNLHACGREFYASSAHIGGFGIERFCKVWADLLGMGGVIFIDERDGQVAGTIGGLIHRDIYGEEMIAEEFFWFVREEFRGGGLRLYRAFKQWAIEQGAASIQMVHMLDLMPEKVGSFYLRDGYKPVETRYSLRLAA